MDTRLRELRFVNKDATPKECVVHVSTASVADVMAWYGSYFSGDDYDVFVNGKKVEKDLNGEFVSPLIEVQP